MAYDGFYGGLSSRASINEVIRLAQQMTKEIKDAAADSSDASVDASAAAAAALGSANSANNAATRASASAEASAGSANESKIYSEIAASGAEFAIAAKASAEEALAHALTSEASATESSVSADASQVSAERAEFAAAAAMVSFGIYSTVAEGLAATTNGQFFSVAQEASQTLITLYKNVSGTAISFGEYPNAVAVQKPLWAGKKNAWPDPFFRLFSIKSKVILGVPRWWSNVPGNNTPETQGGWEIGKSSLFDGNTLRRKVGVGSVPLSGPAIHLSDIGAKVGDSVSVCQVLTGTGATVSCYVRFDTGSDRSYVGPQVGMTLGSGGYVIVAGGDPVVANATLVVPEGAKRISMYSYTDTPDKMFEIHSVWSFLGTLTQGPSWPTLHDDTFDLSRQLVVDTKLQGVDAKLATDGSRITTLEVKMEAVQASSAFAVDQVSKVTSTSEVVALNGSGYSTNPRDLVFMGWGESYSNTGATFNALRVKEISREPGTVAKWRTLGIVVRDGAVPIASAKVVATGSVQVLAKSDLLRDITFVLKDPLTGLPKTLTDADFTSGSYFIGVYALTATGDPAACGEPRGDLPNTLGQAYYYYKTGTLNPISGAWSASSAATNRRLAFQHLSLTGVVEGFDFAPSQAFIDAVGGGTGPSPEPVEVVPELILPPTVYGVQGIQGNMYFGNLTKGELETYSVDVAPVAPLTVGGSQLNEALRWTPTGAFNGEFRVSLINKTSGKVLVSGTSKQKSVATAAGTGLNKKVIVLGDSLIAKGTITQTLIELQAEDPMKLTLLGTQGSGANKHEGRGGWSVASYTSPGVTTYRFTVSGIVEEPAINATEYTHNGAVYRVQETELTAGSGTITCSVVSGGAPTSSGVLTKRNTSAGDATINFSSFVTLSGNPLWHGGGVNFGAYLTANSIETPDWVIIGLGINDVFAPSTDEIAESQASAAIAQMDVIINSIRANSTNTKVALMIPSPPSFHQDSFGANYQAGQTRDRFKRNILGWAKVLIQRNAGKEANGLYLLPSNVALDTVNNMMVDVATPVNSRSTITVSRQMNGVHPAASGYRQLGDSLWAFLKCNA